MPVFVWPRVGARALAYSACELELERVRVLVLVLALVLALVLLLLLLLLLVLLHERQIQIYLESLITIALVLFPHACPQNRIVLANLSRLSLPASRRGGRGAASGGSHRRELAFHIVIAVARSG